MRYAVIAERRESRGRSDESRFGGDGVQWARLGDQLVVWTAGRSWGRTTESMDDARSANVLSLEDEAGGRLYLVIQHGRAFQAAQPDVQIVIDKGRHLVVDLRDDELVNVIDPEEHHWIIRPLPANSVVVENVAPEAREAEPAIQALVGAVSSTSYMGYLSWFAALPTRHSLSPHFVTAANQAVSILSAFGYQTELRDISVAGGTSHNVVADRAGQGQGSRELVLITAHLDSVNLAGGAAANAPGADDNASGSAGVLEIARILATVPAQHDVRLILFGGEEQGLHGSTQYVTALSPGERARIRAVVNMDMVAVRNTPSPTVLLEGANVSQSLITELANAAATYTSLTVETSLNPFASDHVPFINALMPAVLTIEGADSANTNIHSANDTLAHIDDELAIEIIKMNLATVARLLGVQGRAQPGHGAGSSPVVSSSANQLHVFVRGSDSGIYLKRWDGTTWLPAIDGWESLGRVPPDA